MPLLCRPLFLFSSAVTLSLSVSRSSGVEGEEEEEVVHTGNAIMSFYSALIDLLGRCAPEMHVSQMLSLTQRYLATTLSGRMLVPDQ